MASEYINFIVFLEKTLGTYYGRIKSLPRLEGVKTVLEFMEVHSLEHAEIIEGIEIKHPKPTFREGIIADFQNNLTKSVFERVSGENDILKVLQILADSEESLGKLYESISGMMRKISEHYQNVAEEIEKIGQQELNHRDLLLKDRERLAKKLSKD